MDPNPVANETIRRQLRWRYATKKFDPARRIPDHDWQTLEQALILSPSSGGLQPWKFVAVSDPAVKAKLPAISWNQPQVRDASHVVVFAAKQGLGLAEIERHVGRIAEVRGVAPESLAGFKQMMAGSLVPPPPGFDVTAWASRQVYVALGIFMATATMLGIDTCPMEGIQGPMYDELFGLGKEGYAALAVCAAGYRAADDGYDKLPKVRYNVGDVVTRVGS